MGLYLHICICKCIEYVHARVYVHVHVNVYVHIYMYMYACWKHVFETTCSTQQRSNDRLLQCADSCPLPMAGGLAPQGPTFRA